LQQSGGRPRVLTAPAADSYRTPRTTQHTRPPRNDAKGIAIAVGLIATWAALFYHGCWHVRLTDGSAGPRSHVLDIVATFLLLEFVNTGLFITTHDAMHGTICYSNRRLNDWLGRVAITCYAYFDYNMLHKNHWEVRQGSGCGGGGVERGGVESG
jgi:fatty acid desaturase